MKRRLHVRNDISLRTRLGFAVFLAVWSGTFHFLTVWTHHQIDCTDATAAVSFQEQSIGGSNITASSFPRNAEPPKSSTAVIRSDPAYWIVEEEDDFYERTYDLPTRFSRLRQNNGVRHYFPHICGLYRFNITMLPTVSVIMTLRNELPGMTTLSVHSILARTPPSLLVEIIIVNDDPADKENSLELQTLLNFSDKVVLHTNTEREGCARSRLIGASMARGTVLMFIDSHIEMLSGTWYEHLVMPILDNPHTLASQQLQVMDDGDRHKYLDATSRGSQYGTTSKTFTFSYESHRFKNDLRHRQPAPTADPYEMPFAPGALFAIRKDEFQRLGGYDRGIHVWGAENMELSLKIWLCGGRLVQVPCSASGHMYRSARHPRPSWDEGSFPGGLLSKLHVDEDGEGAYLVHGSDQSVDLMNRIWLRNNIRVAKLWLGEWRNYYYKHVFGSKELSPEWLKFENVDDEMLEQIRIQQQNQCRGFDWFDKHVFMRLLGIHNPWYSDWMSDHVDQTD